MKATRIALLALLALLPSCARQGFPSGGDKDVTPPKALSSKPASESRNFDSKEFFILFDEYVVLKNPAENVLVSPPLRQKPEYTTKGKGVLVKLNDTLEANATYLFQFKEAIADFTEGNTLPSFEYVFSTGDSLDTLMLAGRVVNARDGKPWKEAVTMMAYCTDSVAASPALDTIGCATQPNYVTRCDKKGNYAFHYIPQGSYRLVALEDKNRNLRVDEGEAVAWDTVATASAPHVDSAAIPNYHISSPDNRQQRVTSSAFLNHGRLRITTLLPMQQPLLSGARLEWRLNERRDTMEVWLLDARCDTATLVLSDSSLQDTLKLHYRASKPKPKFGGFGAGAPQATEEPLVKALCDGTKAFYDDLRLAFTNPIVSVADSAQAEVMLLKDSSVTRCPLTLDSTGLTARMRTSLKSDETYRVRLAPALFTDLYGRRSDSLVFTLTPKDYGILSITIDNAVGSPLVVEVLDSRDTVVQRQPLGGSGLLRFSHLPAGDYRLRAVIDANGDGQWTPGDYRRQRQPEASVLFEKTLALREKWEMEERWQVKPPKTVTADTGNGKVTSVSASSLLNKSGKPNKSSLKP